MGMFRQVAVIIGAGAIGLAAVPGCTSYTNVPGPESAPAQQDPNARQAVGATEAALHWVARRHPVAGSYALNLPVGTSRETADAIAAALGPGAVVPEGDIGGMPVYHVTRVWIRLSDAKVDVVYPMVDGQGQRIERGVTVWLHAGVRPWRVSRGQYWAPGTVPTPPIWVPIPQAELDAQAQAAEAAEKARKDAEKAQREAEKQARKAADEAGRNAEPEPAASDEVPADGE